MSCTGVDSIVACVACARNVHRTPRPRVPGVDRVWLLRAEQLVRLAECCDISTLYGVSAV